MTGKIPDWMPELKNIYIPPVPYDAGLAIGTAQYQYHQTLNEPRVDFGDYFTPYLGARYNKEHIEKAIEERGGIKVEQASRDDVVKLLTDKKVVSVYGGRSESGRRALGNRSILADPRFSDMKDIVNERVKHRQWFRPFAPSVLAEDVADWFDRDLPSPYMSFVSKFKEDKLDKVPAVVHFDGTARTQTVTAEGNPWYHDFISRFKKATGVPMVLNTSFNDREPIVETPADAVNCFLKTNIDYLYFFEHDILVSKSEE
jgi:carbamoyltransferase